MSGKRQHFIPRFLLEGFADQQLQTWVHRKDNKPFKTNIINAGVEGYFYSEEGDNLADDIITELEKSFSNLIKDLRLSNSIQSTDPLIPKMIIHLETRTRHFRQNFLLASDYLVTRMFEKLEDENFYRSWFLRRIQNNPSFLRESLSEMLIKNGQPLSMLEPLLKIARSAAPALIEKNMPQSKERLRMIKDKMKNVVRDASKSGHIKVLKKSAPPQIRLDSYKDLTFELVTFPDNDLILGDCIIVFQVENGQVFRSFLDKDQVLKNIFLPISANKVLVGKRGDAELPTDLHHIVARCSLEFFVSNNATTRTHALQDEIGKDALLITKNEMDEIIDDIFGDINQSIDEKALKT